MNSGIPKSILFVDDEARLLQGIQRMLRPMRNVWEMQFVSSGQEALELISKRCFDVIVSDMRMPQIDGATLLQEAQKICPYSIRIVLSGQAEDETILRAVQVAHQYMSKPCDTEKLKKRISNACYIRDLLECHDLKASLSALSRVPSYPEYYESLVAEIESDAPSLQTISAIVAKDPGMTAKILQMSNSSFFGSARCTSDPVESVKSIGVESLRALAFQAHAFEKADFGDNNFWFKHIIDHSHGVQEILESIFVLESFTEEEKWQARTAALLHEIGRVIFATIYPDKYKEVDRLILEEHLSQSKAEYKVFGITHPEVGAYVLALWGLPNQVIDAVAFHHNPNESNQKDFNILSALHVANVLEDEMRPRTSVDTRLPLDTEYMRRLSREDTVEGWLRDCNMGS